MFERLLYPILIASHIKPFIQSSDSEAYDPDNGILLSQNLDGLFDKGYISFDDSGSMIMYKGLDTGLKKYLKNYSLDKVFLKNKRKQYLVFHRKNILRTK